MKKHLLTFYIFNNFAEIQSHMDIFQAFFFLIFFTEKESPIIIFFPSPGHWITHCEASVNATVASEMPVTPSCNRCSKAEKIQIRIGACYLFPSDLSGMVVNVLQNLEDVIIDTLAFCHINDHKPDLLSICAGWWWCVVMSF